MLPDKQREELWGQVSRHFGSEAFGLRSAALELQDIGFGGEKEIREFLEKIWGPAFDLGWDEGFEHGQGES